MCGIFGMASVDKSIDRLQLVNQTNTLSHRGPDDSGFFIDTHAGLGHRRLSIIDLSGGQNPIYNEDQSKCIIFNGEIYNYLEIRKDLFDRGHLFSTRSDTEVILHAYEQWGEACVERLRGMFAFAIWDRTTGELFIARDRLGIKPLFYAEHRGIFYFGSEMKSILAAETFPREIDEFALACYFSLSYIPAPHTIFKRIKKLLPGHTLKWKAGKVTEKKYWDLYFNPDYSKSENYFIDGFMGLLQESVRIRLMSEVPLGAFLSGGIDSSTVVAMMSRASRESINTFCIGFGGDVGGYFDERRYARMMADRYSTNHREHEVFASPDGLIEKIVTAFDEPFADDSTIPSYFVCKIARENVTVALSGLGGDEAFAGYERYLGFRLRNIYNNIPSPLSRSLIPRLIESLPERSDGHYTVNHMKRFVRSASLDPGRGYLGYITVLNASVRRRFFADNGRYQGLINAVDDFMLGFFNSANVADRNDSLNRVLYCDIKTYLPEDILAVTDRMSMLHSLEVRVPFIDHKLMEFCATIPAELKMRWFQKKYLLKKATRNLLPREVIAHRKQGFTGPMAQWLKSDLKAYTMDTLCAKKMQMHGLFNNDTIGTLLNDHFSGKELNDTAIWSLLIFQKWWDLYMHNS